MKKTVTYMLLVNIIQLRRNKMALVPHKDDKQHDAYVKDREGFLAKRAKEEVNATTEKKKAQGDKTRS